MNRRTLLKWISYGGAIPLLSMILNACVSGNSTGSSPSETALADVEDGFVDVGNVEDLTETNTLRYQDSLGNSILVVQDSTRETKSIQAFSSLCSHRGCHVAWQTHKDMIACACHGSQFSADGGVITGPAQRALQKYETKIEAGRILVKATVTS